MARPAPQTNFYVNYGAVTTAVNSDVLAPVFIAPRYAIHNSGYGNAALVDSNGNTVVYSGGSISAQPYPNFSSGLIDTATAQLMADLTTGNGAVIIGNGGSGKAKTEVNGLTLSGAVVSGVVTFSDVVSGPDTKLTLGYQLRPGDTLIFSSGSAVDSAKVTAVSQAAADATCDITKSIAFGATLTGDVTDFAGSTDAVYLAAVTGVTSGGEMLARVNALAGDGGYVSNITLSSGGSVAIGTLGLQIEWTSGAAVTDTTYQIYCTAAGPSGAYVVAKIDNDTLSLTPEATFIQTGNLITDLAPVVSSDCTLGADGVAIKANAKVEYLGAELKIVNCDQFFVDYRELLTDGANELVSGSIDVVKEFVGPMVPENPLGMLYAAGTQSGVLNFYLMSVEDDTDEAYNKALSAAAANEAVYSLFPFRQTEEVINHALEVISYYSDPSISQVKRLWLYSQVEQRLAVMESTKDAPVFGSVSNGTLTLATGSFDSSVKAGAQAVFKNVYTNGVIVPEVTVTIKSITSDAEATIVESGISIPTASIMTVYKKLSPSEYAAEIAAKAKYYNNHRVNFVFSEANTTLDTALQDARYIVPILMSMRAANPPHAPLTDLVIPGTSISASVGFSPTDYETMNNGGVWICYRNRRGEMTTRHAITTGKVNTIAEEDSAVSNGDNILRYVRNSVAFLNGSCNVTPALINKITVNVYQAFDRIMGRAYQDIIGPQILEVENVEIIQDPNNSAGVIGTFDLNLPEPYLEGNFTFNLF